MSDSGGVKEGLTPKEFFESEWYKDGCRQLCADGWPTFIVPVNIQIKKIQSENQALQKRIDVLERAKIIWERRNGDASDLNDASQEAQHYNWLDEQNEKLEKENQGLREEIAKAQAEYKRRTDEVNLLIKRQIADIKEIERLRVAIMSLTELGKRDLSNPKYDSVFVELREALQSGGDESPSKV